MTTTFRGIYPALVTPMTEREEVDLPKLEALVEYLIGAGVQGLIPLGSTGEFYALSPQERRDVLATVVRTTAGRVPVVAGVNAAATRSRAVRPRSRSPGGQRRHGRPAVLLAA